MIRCRAIAAVVLCLAAVAAAQMPLAEKLPARTVCYIASAGQTQAFLKSRLGQLGTGDHMTRVIEQLKRAILLETSPRTRQTLEPFLEMIHTGARGPACFAVVDALEKDERQPSLAIIADLGNNEKAFTEQFEAFIKTAPADYFRMTKFGNVTLRDHPEEHERWVIGIANGHFYFIFGQKLPEEIFELTPEKSLARDPEFRTHLQPLVAKDVQIAAFARVDDLIDQMVRLESGPDEQRLQQTRQQVAAITEGLGVSKATCVAYASGQLPDGGMVSRLKIVSPAPHQGVLLFAAGAAVDEKSLAHVPADALYAAAVNVPARRILLESQRAFGRLLPGAGNIDRVIQQVAKETGVNLLTDVYDNLGDVWTVSLSPSAGGLTGLVLSVELKDAKAFAAAAGKFETWFAANVGADRQDQWGRVQPVPSIQTIQAGGAAIKSLVLPVSRDPMPVAPAWMIHDGRLWVAAWPQVLQHVAESGPDEPRLIDTDAWKALRAKLPKQASTVVYTDTGKLATHLYPALLGGWTTLANLIHAEERMAFLPGWLPTPRHVQQLFTPGMTTLIADDDGILLESHGSVPSSFIEAFPALLPMASGAALPLTGAASGGDAP